jgi:hypothetical protein
VRGAPGWEDDLPKDEISDVSGQIPLGVFRNGGRLIWVAEVPLGETATFVLYDVSLEGVREALVIDGGGC